MHKNILKEIVHIRFPDLQFINLEYNWIISIEPLQFLNAPNIRWINIKYN